MSGLVVVVCGLWVWLSYSNRQQPEANTVMIFLSGVAFPYVAARHGAGAVCCHRHHLLLVLHYFFAPFFLQLAVSDIHYLVIVGVMLVIGLVISTLTSRLKGQLARRPATFKTARITICWTKAAFRSLSGWSFLIDTAANN